MKGEFIVPRSSEPKIRAIYTPDAQRIAEGVGKVTIARASNVEPTDGLSEEAKKHLACFNRLGNSEHYKGQPPLPANKWWADMTPVNGPVLGPYEDRDTALAEEVKWLEDNNIPVCGECRTQIEPPTSPVLTQADLADMDVEP